MHVLPGRACARRFQAAAEAERLRDRTARSAELDRAYGDVRRTFPRRAPFLRFGFEQIDKRDRILAGLVADAILSGKATAEPPDPVRQALQALGPDTVAGLTRILERGSTLQVRRLLHWHRGVAPERRQVAIKAALDRHSGAAPGSQTGPGTQKPPEERRMRRPAGRKRDDGLGR